MHLLVPASLTALIAAISLSATTSAVPATGSRPPPEVHQTVTTTATGTTTLTNAEPATPTTHRAGPRRSLHLEWPLSPRPAVRRPFEQPRNQWAPGHRGVDLSAAVGQPVLSAGEGVVAFSGMVAGRGVTTVRHPGGLRTTYEPVDQRVASGTRVRRGARIGVVSTTAGHCVPLTCLHWGALFGQTYRDPLSLLGLGRPILLPLG